MENNISLYPSGICLLSSEAILLITNFFSDLIHQFHRCISFCYLGVLYPWANYKSLNFNETGIFYTPNKTKRCFFEKISKIDKPFARLIKKRREKTQVNRIRNDVSHGR